MLAVVLVQEHWCQAALVPAKIGGGAGRREGGKEGGTGQEEGGAGGQLAGCAIGRGHEVAPKALYP